MLLTALLIAGALKGAGPKEAPTKVEPVAYTRQEDLVYSRKFGTATTLDIFKPKAKWNGAIVIWVVSGGWHSDHAGIKPEDVNSPVKGLIRRGYQVAAVVHRSNPMFTIEDALEDVKRAVRFVRKDAAKDGHSTAPIGIYGSSAGGHISLIMGTTADDGVSTSPDPLERVSDRVQAVACFFPPTDFLNYGGPGINCLDTTLVEYIRAPFQFKRYNASTKTVDRVTTPSLIHDILVAISPISHVTRDDAPTMIITGDNDALVPHQQQEIFADRMRKAGAEIKLEILPGKGHGWFGINNDMERLFDWFDEKLLGKSGSV